MTVSIVSESTLTTEQTNFVSLLAQRYITVFFDEKQREKPYKFYAE